MHISIFKNKKEFWNNYFKMYDPKGKNLKLAMIFFIIVVFISLMSPVDYNYIHGLKTKYTFYGYDNLYDYTIPLVCVFIMFLVFYEDYKNNIYEFIIYLNNNKFNYIIFYRWSIFVSLFMSGSFISGLIYYRNISFLDVTNLLLSIRFIPNIIFLSSLFLLITTVSKNIYASLFLIATYSIVDLQSSGGIFKLLSIGANSNNFYYRISPIFYILNRSILVILSIIFVYISCKYSWNLSFFVIKKN
jgi:hypothetical protein